MRLIDADRLIDEFEDTIGNPISRTRLKLQVQNQPTIDAVEVVRCKDCKWYDTRFVVCHNPRFGDGWANYQPPKVREDFFCNDGERKTDG